MSDTDARRLDEDGPAAPPRRNGELAFDAPWERRLFGVTMALVEAGSLDWERFRARLIAEIGRPRGEWSYWDRWRTALEGVLADDGLVDGGALGDAAAALAARPHGHDH